MDAWPPRASYPCGNFSDTSCPTTWGQKGSLGLPFGPGPSTGGTSECSISPYFPREVSVLTELHLGHLRYVLTDVPPQPNSPSALVLDKPSKCQQQRPQNNRRHASLPVAPDPRRRRGSSGSLSTAFSPPPPPVYIRGRKFLAPPSPTVYRRRPHSRNIPPGIRAE